VDAQGNPLPYYTYPAIRYFSEIDFSNCDVLEFGAGNSTVWWDKHAKSVTTLETEKKWQEHASQRVSSKTNVLHVHSPEHAVELIGDKSYDVVVVDDTSGEPTGSRVPNVCAAIRVTKPTGILIVDNSNDWYSGDLASIGRAAGLRRVDFVGFSGGTIREFCTSILFRPDTCQLWPQHGPMNYLS
jgi:hypothetical protein